VVRRFHLCQMLRKNRPASDTEWVLRHRQNAEGRCSRATAPGGHP
jgi:hypothetical protein